MNILTLRFWLLAFIGYGLLAGRAHATNVVCVGNSQQLVQAFSLAEQTNVDTIIEVVRSATPYDVSAHPSANLDATLRVRGGFAPGCASRIIDPANTVIDFGGKSAVFGTPLPSDGQTVEFDGLTLRHGAQLYLAVGHFSPFGPDDGGEIRVTNARVTDFHWISNDVGFGNRGTITLDTTSSRVTLTNLLIDHVTQDGASACMFEYSFQGNSNGNLSYLTVDLPGGKGFCFDTNEGNQEAGDFRMSVYNSIFWSSDKSAAPLRGIVDFGALHVDLVDDIFAAYVGDGDVYYSGQSAPAYTDPLWLDPVHGNYHLAPSSGNSINAAINSGALVVPFGSPLTDIEGGTRQIGSRPDRGAFESGYTDSDLFIVTNAADCNTPGCGSLRDRINLANASSAASATILFSIPTACPAVISLGSPLPDITKPMLINGYTQNGSAPNNDALAFDATLCVVVQPANSTYYALRVPADPAGAGASLYLAGIGFGAFPVGVELLGGSDHQIVGNQFGGYINDYGFQLFGQTVAGVYAAPSSGSFIIGGDDPANRNVFLNTQSYAPQPAAAVLIGPQVNTTPDQCQIVGNTIGVQDDGTFSSKNVDYGIYIAGSGCSVRGNRIAGVFKDAIDIDGSAGGNDNVVQNNTLGLVAYGLDLSSSNGGAGIRISGSHNIIGQAAIAGSAVTAPANLIENMDGGGVLVVGNGTGNTIRGNTIFNNGPGGTGMGIDLRADGPTDNDPSDADSGPNNLQNFPVVHGLAFATPPVPTANPVNATLNGTLTTFIGPGFYQIDVYYAQGCDGNGRGIAQQWIGSVDNVYIASQALSAAFSAPVVLPAYAPGDWRISVTATNNSNGEGSTSELGACIPVDTIFRDGVDGR